jgi:NitT/TauT family transport system permease protein
VVLGLIIGSALGIALGIISSKVSAVSYLLSPILVLVKSTPVASFIILLWATLNGNALAIFIALLMVFPIIYQNTISAFDNIDQDLEEVCIVYRFSWWKRMRYLLIPTLLKFLVPAFITSVGLAWKAEVAAEIVGYVKDSIGAHINDAFPHTDTVFAWTLVIIAFSLALEYATRYLLWRIKTDD